MSTRAERERLARELRAQGLKLREIGEQMGVSLKTVDAWLNDPGGLRLKARKATYHSDPCINCGAPTSSSAGNGYRDEPLCFSCAVDKRTVWTPEAVVCAIQEWAAVYGEPPAMCDWNPYGARHRFHDEQRARRFEDAGGRWPSFKAAVNAFGSWNAAIEAAGFEPRVNHGGGGNGARHRSMREAA